MCTSNGEFIIDSMGNLTFNANENIITKFEISKIFNYFHFPSNSCKLIEINLESRLYSVLNESLTKEKAFEQVNFTGLKFSNNAIIISLLVKEPLKMLDKGK